MGLLIPLEVGQAVAGIRVHREAVAEEDTHFEHQGHRMEWPHQELAHMAEGLAHKAHTEGRVRQARMAEVQILARRDKGFEDPEEDRWVQAQSDNVRSQE